MSGSQQLLLGETGGGGDSGPVYIENVFSTYLYTGNGTSQTITNGIDLSTKGGLVWIKSRQSGSAVHSLYDTQRGVKKRLSSDLTNAEFTYSTTGVTAFGTTGFSIADNSNGDDNVNGAPGGTYAGADALYASWTFREQPKFFDVVTYTGNGVDGRQIAHSLGSTPGFVIVKRTDATSNWQVRADAQGYGWNLLLNSTVAGDTATTFENGNISGVSSTTFTVSNGTTNFNNVNTNGGTYVAYLFAHNAGGFGLTGTDNVISCGSFTTDGSGNATINLGYEPQWLLQKSSDASGNWFIADVMRGMTVSAAAQLLRPNLSNAESAGSITAPTSTGYTVTSFAPSTTYIYIAIRRGPMKVPTTGTSVFAVSQAVEPDTSALFAAGFSDMVLHSPRVSAGGAGNLVTDRLRGAGLILLTQSENAENDQSGFPYTKFDSNAGAYIPAGGYYNNSGGGSSPYVMSAFRRAPQFFDEVCYTGNSANRTLSHNLGVAPELMIVKKRSSGSTSNWVVYPGPLANPDYYLFINSDMAVASVSILWNSTAPTSTVFSLGASINANDSGQTYVNYLFATCAGVSKVGSYTGTGSTQTINCGFTGGARWVMIKRTDATGDWFYWNSASGIVAGNDPYLLLNTTSAQVTGTDYVDTAASGFEISSTAPAAINANGGTFIFLAIA